MGIACTVAPGPVRRKGLLGKIKNLIDHLDDKPNGCFQCCEMSNNACCGPRCGYAGCGLAGCSTAAPCFQRGPCCGPATWSPYCPPTIIMPSNCCNSSCCGQC